MAVGSLAAKDSTVSARRYYQGGSYSQPDYYGGGAGSHGAYPLANNQYGGGYVPVVQPPNYYGGSYGSHQQHHQPANPYGSSYPGSNYYSSPYPSSYGTNPAYGNLPY